MRPGVLALSMVATLLLAAGCKSPDLPSGTIQCGEAGCPSGMECRDDGFCWTSGQPEPDSSTIDASTEPITLPAGAVIFVRAEICPDGYKELATARGRAIVAAGGGAVVGQQVGDALTDLGERHITATPSHTHTVELGTANSDSDTHSHSKTSTTSHDATGGGSNPQEVSDANSTITLSEDTHAHTLNIPEFTSASSGEASVDVTTPYLQLLACVRE